MCLQLNEGADSIIHLVRVVVAARLPGWPPCHPSHCSLHHPCSPRGSFQTQHPTPLHTPHTSHLRLSCSVLTCISSPSSSYSSAATASRVLTLRGDRGSKKRQENAVGLMICLTPPAHAAALQSAYSTRNRRQGHELELIHFLNVQRLRQRGHSLQSAHSTSEGGQRTRVKERLA